MSGSRPDPGLARHVVAQVTVSALPYPEADIAANARRAHDVISEALKEARAVRAFLKADGDPIEASRRLGIASNAIGSAAFFLREAIAMRNASGAAPQARRA